MEFAVGQDQDQETFPNKQHEIDLTCGAGIDTRLPNNEVSQEIADMLRDRRGGVTWRSQDQETFPNKQHQDRPPHIMCMQISIAPQSVKKQPIADTLREA